MLSLLSGVPYPFKHVQTYFCALRCQHTQVICPEGWDTRQGLACLREEMAGPQVPDRRQTPDGATELTSRHLCGCWWGPTALVTRPQLGFCIRTRLGGRMFGGALPKEDALPSSPDLHWPASLSEETKLAFHN